MISAREKIKHLTKLGIKVDEIILPNHISINDFENLLQALSNSQDNLGIIVQLPIPETLSPPLQSIDQRRDIDSLTVNNPYHTLCATAEAALRLIDQYKNETDNIAVVGANGFVGSSVVKGIQLRNYSYSSFDVGDDLISLRDYSIIVTAMGQPAIITEKHLGGQKLVVDIGFTPQNSHSKMVLGDVARHAYSLVQNIIPVPKGIGPLEMTVLAERVLGNFIYDCEELRIDSNSRLNPHAMRGRSE